MNSTRCPLCGIVLAAVLFIFCLSCCSSMTDDGGSSDTGINRNTSPDSWTLMFYLGGDNTLDSKLVANVAQLMEGYCGGMNAVLLVDRCRSAASAEPFGEAFETTRMYRVTSDGLVRIYGGTEFPELSEDKGDCELDTADAAVLRNFIRCCKAEYPAGHYGLIIGSHGGGVRTGNQNVRAVVQDAESDNDWLFTAELTDVLSAEESVDVLAFDACCMGSLEVAYQLCGVKGFKADYIVVSPAEEWSDGWDYARLASAFGTKLPEPRAFAEGLVANYREYIAESSQSSLQTLTCLQGSAVPAVKEALDGLSRLLVDFRSETEALRGSGRLQQEDVLHYFNSVYTSAWLQYAYFDIYSLAERMAASAAFPQAVRTAASELARAVDAAVLCSYAGSAYTLAREGASGLAVFFPNGRARCGYAGRTYWDYQYWYNALPVAERGFDACYGSLAFCADGAAEGNGVVENWFELLDYWFDDGRNVNGYIP